MATRLAFLLLVAAMTVKVHAQNPYCKLCSDHTMCQYQGRSPTCQEYQGGVSASDQKIIVDEHNKYRMRVANGQETLGKPGPQPGATNMEKMFWDAELATIAQRLADQCNYKHDSCRKVQRYQVGQNIAQQTSSTATPVANWPVMVKLWYDEVSKYSKNDVKIVRFTMDTGHYTQVVWAKTNRVGCGFSTYKKGGSYEQFYVCNYGPAGNFGGQEVYGTGGAVCSKCPAGSNRVCSGGLCSP